MKTNKEILHNCDFDNWEEIGTNVGTTPEYSERDVLIAMNELRDETRALLILNLVLPLDTNEEDVNIMNYLSYNVLVKTINQI